LGSFTFNRLFSRNVVTFWLIGASKMTILSPPQSRLPEEVGSGATPLHLATWIGK